MSDPGTSYRTRDEIQEVRQTRDPIMLFRENIISAELVTADELKVNIMISFSHSFFIICKLPVWQYFSNEIQVKIIIPASELYTLS